MSFLDKYYKYGDNLDPDKRGPIVREFESAFLADIEASDIFNELSYILERHIRFLCTYRNDKIIAFNGQKLNKWLLNWLATFQREVDRLLGTADIQFMMEIWQPGKISTSLQNSEALVEGNGAFHHASINGNNSFPCLDIQLSWDNKGRLYFSVYKKPGVNSLTARSVLVGEKLVAMYSNAT